MADTKVSALSPVTPVLTDVTYIVDDPGGTPASGSMTLQALMDLFEANFAAPSTAITSGTFADARISESSVTQHEAALTLTTSQISDYTEVTQDTVGAMLTGNTETLITVTYQDADGTIDFVVDNDLANYSNVNSAFISDITGESIADLSDVTLTTPAQGDILYRNASGWVNLAPGTSGHFLKTNGAGANPEWAAGAGGGISNVVEDTTPQLGGNLDVNGNSIVSVSNGNITIAPNGTGNVILGNYVLNADATVGAGQDNYVLTYDHAAGTWGPEASAGGGGTMSSFSLAGTSGTPQTISDGNTLTVAAGTGITTTAGATDTVTVAIDSTVATLTGSQVLTNKTIGAATISGDLIPNADGTVDLGSATNRYAVVHTDSIDLNGVTLDGTTLADPGADRILFWDDSAGTTAYLTAGTGLSISTTNLTIDSTVATLTGTQTLTNKTLTDPKVSHGYNAQTGTTYTLVAADQSKVITMSNASANTLTIPPNSSVAFPVGTVVTIFQLGAGVTTIAGGTGVTLTGNGGSGSAFSADIQTQYGAATIIKIATDQWLISGDIDTVAA